MNTRNGRERSRVVITGMGAISPLGSSVELMWSGLIHGRSGIRRIPQFDPVEFPCQIAGEIPDFNPEDYMEKKEARRIPRSAQIALAAAIQAVKDSGLPDTMAQPERSGVVLMCGRGGGRKKKKKKKTPTPPKKKKKKNPLFSPPLRPTQPGGISDC